MKNSILLLTCSLLMTNWATCLTVDLAQIEDQLRQLQEDCFAFKKASVTTEEKVDALKQEIKVLQDEIVQLKDEATLLKQDSLQLKAKVSRLESRGLRQQWQIDLLLKEHPAVMNLNSAEVKDSSLSVVGEKNSGFPRTCQEIIDENPDAPSGQYWIDPDGKNIGVDPIYVDCVMSMDKTLGKTIISHDSEDTIEADQYSTYPECITAGCYTRVIRYNASSSQLQALAELSNECHQEFRYGCVRSPLEFNGMQYAWWTDRKGNPQYYWAEDYSDVGLPQSHLCECGILGNCLNYKKCNCDAALNVKTSDIGTIKAKNNLPVMKLNFGFPLPDSFGEHTLGKFECSGKISVSGMPTSCDDLWILGHSINGIYLIKGAKRVESVYCDFSQQSNKQTWLGSVDVKSTPVYFYVQRSNTYHGGSPLPFDRERLNIGGAMNLSSGKFTAPKPGRYFFSFSGVAIFEYKTGYFDVILYLNGNIIGYGEANTAGGGDMGNDDYETCTLQSVLHLDKGDQVWLGISARDNSWLQDRWDGHYSHFTGMLLEEDIF